MRSKELEEIAKLAKGLSREELLDAHIEMEALIAQYDMDPIELSVKRVTDTFDKGLAGIEIVDEIERCYIGGDNPERDLIRKDGVPVAIFETYYINNGGRKVYRYIQPLGKAVINWINIR